MEHYNNEISREVKTQPKNKKKVILISVIAVAVIFLIFLSSLIPALILNAKIESLMESKDFSDAKYFYFKPNNDYSGYMASLGMDYILPEKIVFPNTYEGFPVTEAWCTLNKQVKILTLPEGISACYIIKNSSLEEIYLPRSITILEKFSINGIDAASIEQCENLKKVYYHKETIIEDFVIERNPDVSFIPYK